MLKMHSNCPVLDYDDSPLSRVSPEIGNDLPAACLVTSFSDVLTSWTTEFEAKEKMLFATDMRKFPVYEITHRDRTLALTQLCEGAGMAALQTEFLISRGVKTLLLADSAGTLIPGTEEKLFLPGKALRDEGVSYKYLPPSEFVNFSPDLIKTGKSVLENNEIPYEDGPVWTGEALYRITGETLRDRLDRGCVLCDRASAAMAAVAAFRNVRFAALFCAG